MAGPLDTVTASIGSSLDFAMKNFRELAVRIAKIYLLTFGIFIAALALLAAFAIALGGASMLSGNAAMLLPLILVAALVLIAVAILNASIGMVRFVAVEDVSRNADTRIIAAATPLMPAVVVYSIASLVLIGVFVGLPMALGVVAMAGLKGAAGFAVFILAMAVAVILAILFGLFLQFATLDIAINKSGGIDALRNSYALVRKNLAAVIIYDIILFVISFAIGVVFGVLNELLSLGFALGAFNIALLAVVLVVYFAVVIAESILINTVLTPVEYFFWKSIGGKR